MKAQIKLDVEKDSLQILEKRLQRGQGIAEDSENKSLTLLSKIRFDFEGVYAIE